VPFRLFSTLNNKAVEKALAERLPGVLFTGDPDSADAAFLVAKSGSVGVPEVQRYFSLAGKVPVALLLSASDPDAAVLKEEAARAGVSEVIVAEGNRFPAGQVVEAVKRLADASRRDTVIVSEQAVPERDSSKETCASPPGVELPKPKILEFLESAEHVCAFFGAKGGVGTSTAVAAAVDVLKEYGTLHLELADAPAAWCYYGKTFEEAERSGRYRWLWDGVSVPRCRVLLVDIGNCPPAEAVSLSLAFSKCRVLVADGSEMSFKAVRRLLEAGAVPDILVVSRVVVGVGNGAEMYAGEFESFVFEVVGLPGSVDVEKAVVTAQRRGIFPCGLNAELDAAAGEIGAAIREKLGV
jgi:hypothetical protein